MGQQAHQEQSGTDQDALQLTAVGMLVVVFMAMIVFMFVMMAALAFVIVVLMLVMMTAAALMIVMLVLVMMTAAAFMVMVLMFMMMTAATLVVMVFVLMVVTATAAAITMFMVMVPGRLPASGGSGIPGIDFHIALNGAGNSDQLRNQRIRVSRSEPQLLGGKGDDSLFHIGVGIEFRFNLGSAVGAVQILDDVDLAGHWDTSLHRYMSKRSCVYPKYSARYPGCQYGLFIFC
jgi:hypothetical protein